MMVADVGKLAMLALVVVSVTILAALDVLPADSTERALTLILGYLVGNGVLARTKQAPSPVLAPRHLDHEGA